MCVTGWITGANSDLCSLGGVILTGRLDAIGWLAGAAAQLVVAIVAAIVYAVIFEFVTRRAGPLIGLAIAVPHVIVAGLAMGFIPAFPLIDAGIGPPGAFMEYRGRWVIATFVLDISCSARSWASCTGTFTTLQRPLAFGGRRLTLDHRSAALAARALQLSSSEPFALSPSCPCDATNQARE